MPVLKIRVSLLAFLCIFFVLAGVSCFSADKEPDDEDSQLYSDDDDDAADDKEDDDANDDVDDDIDDDGNDDVDDDTDDDADDDTQPPLSCEEIMALVYDVCTDEFAWKSPPNQELSKSEALDECNSGGLFWECVDACFEDVIGTCDNLEECINDLEDGCDGSLIYNKLG